MSDFVTLSVIIVSYNTREMTLKCLEVLGGELELLASQHISAEVWVVDNASTDGTCLAIQEQFPTVQLIASPQNLGFGRANNLAMEQARGTFFLLLNSDAFPRPGALLHLKNCLDAHREAAVIGPRLLNKDGSLQPSCWKFPSPGRAWVENLGLAALFPRHPRLGDYSRWPHDSQRSVGFVIGACMLVRREVYEQVGGFDPEFFMYAEETDWQKRMRRAGWEIVFTPQAEVEHWGGASGNGQINEYFFRSLDIYELKHHGRSGLVALRLAMIFGNLLRLPLWVLKTVTGNQRRQSLQKVRLILWLLRRQAFHWKKL